MSARSRPKLLTRLTGLVLGLAMSAYAAVAPAAVLRCDLGCGPQAVAEVGGPGGGGETVCCDRHTPVSPADPSDDAPQQHEHRGGGCCPQACPGCVGRSLFVASNPVPALTVAARPLAAAAPTAQGESLDVACSIFHPPKA